MAIRNPAQRRITRLGMLLALAHAVAAASPPPTTISSEGDPAAPVLSFQGLIVNAGNDSNGGFSSGASFVAAPGRLAKVDGPPVVAGGANPQPTLADCSRSCTATPRCSAFLWCGGGDGPCAGALSGDLPEFGCELAIQAEALPARMAPFLVTGAAAPPALVSGAPIQAQAMAAAPPLPGYLQLFAQSFYNQHDYNCTGTLIDGSCALPGAAPALAPACDADPLCALMAWYPQGREDLGPGSVTLFKGGPGVLFDVGAANLNHRAVSYLKLGRAAAPGAAADGGEGGDGGGLSAGAASGIAVGAAAAGAAAGAAAVALAGRSARRVAKSDAEAVGSPPATPPSSSSAGRVKPSASSLAPVPSCGAITVVPHRAPASPFESSQGGAASSLASFPLLHDASVTAAAAAAATPGGPPPPPRPGGSGSGSSGAGGTGTSADPFAAGSPTSVTAASARGIVEAIRDAPDWARYSVDPAAVRWLRRPDGSLDELGRGAFSRVYKVTLDGAVALAAKVIPLEDARAEAVFAREVKTLFHLRHPNIPQFVGVSMHAGQGLLLMELLEGGSLYAAMGARDSSGRRRVGWPALGRRIALGVSQALAYLHSLGQIHLDVKSANVLLTRDAAPKLADVGLTRLRDTLDAGASSVRDSRMGGTFAYMAPELLLGGVVSAAADVYSFGVLLREVATGEHPSRGRARAPRVPEECPQAVADLIMACLRLAPGERPTARQVHAALQACPH